MNALEKLKEIVARSTAGDNAVTKTCFGWMDSKCGRSSVKRDYLAARAAFRSFMENHAHEILDKDAKYLLSARSIGIPIKRGTLVFNSEEEMTIFHDYMLLIETPDGERRISKFLTSFPAEGRDAETELAVRCLSSLKYTFLYTKEAIPGLGLKCQDLVTGESLFLTDVNFSESLPHGGAMLMGTGIVSHGSAWMTTGAAIPILMEKPMPPEMLDAIVRNEILKDVKWRKKIPFQPDASQMAEMARAYLRKSFHLRLTDFVRFE